MVKAVDILDDQNLIDHLVRRVIAYIIDVIIVLIAIFILTAIIGIGFLTKGLNPFFGFFGILGTSWLSAGVWLLYSTLMEGSRGDTLGKRILSLRVEHRSGRMDFKDALLRNLSKVHVVLLIVDGIVGIFTDGDPRERFLDRIAGTVVVRTDIDERFPPGSAPASFQRRPVPHSPRPAPRTQAYRR